MSSLTDTYIEDTYDGVIHADGPLPVSGVAKLYDGVGNPSALGLGQNEVNITGTLNIGTSSLIDYIYPVGSIYLGATNVSPALLWSGTTWAQVAGGRFLAGVGTGTDKNTIQKVIGAGNSADGEYQHTQTTSELAPHTHNLLYDAFASGSGIPGEAGTTGNSTATTESTGNGTPFNTTPPAFGVYVWQRTS